MSKTGKVRDENKKKYHTQKNITFVYFLFIWVFYYRVFLGQKSKNAAKSRFRILWLLKKFEKNQKTDDTVGIAQVNCDFLKTNVWAIFLQSQRNLIFLEKIPILGLSQIKMIISGEKLLWKRFSIMPTIVIKKPKNDRVFCSKPKIPFSWSVFS